MTRVKQIIKNLGISQKFIMSLLIFVIIPLVILLFIVNYNVRLDLNKKTCETNLEILKQTGSGIQNFVNDIKQFSLSIGTDSDVQELIKKYNKGASPSEKEKQKVNVSYQVRMKLESRDNIRSISIFNQDDIIYQFGDYVLEEDKQFVPQLIELGGIPLWTRIHNGKTTSYGSAYQKIYMLQAINDMYTFKPIAYQRLTIDEASLRKQYRGIIEGQSKIVIVGEDGNILSSSDKSDLGKQLAEIEPDGLPETKDGYSIRKDTVISWYSLSKPSWKIIKIDPPAQLFQSNNVSNGIIFSCILFTIIFGMVFMIIQRKTIIIPIVKLSHEARNFKKENFKMPIYIDSEDEIGKLNRNLSQMMDYIQDLILNQYQNEIKNREIELKYMQSQINPHFLYNTLDSIRWMAIIEDQTKIAEQVEALSDIFRHSLSGGRDTVTVGQEIEHLKSYLLIQKNRFGDRLRTSIEIEPRLSECLVLKLILQPLVENAIVHGLEGKLEGGTVKITVKEKNEALVYIVEDDGVGADEEMINNCLKEDGQYNVFALKNVNERIKIKYGNKYGLSFHSTPMQGTKVVVCLPIICEN